MEGGRRHTRARCCVQIQFVKPLPSAKASSGSSLSVVPSMALRQPLPSVVVPMFSPAPHPQPPLTSSEWRERWWGHPPRKPRQSAMSAYQSRIVCPPKGQKQEAKRIEHGLHKLWQDLVNKLVWWAFSLLFTYPATLLPDPVNDMLTEVVQSPADDCFDNIRNSGHQGLEAFLEMIMNDFFAILVPLQSSIWLHHRMRQKQAFIKIPSWQVDRQSKKVQQLCPSWTSRLKRSQWQLS